MFPALKQQSLLSLGQFCDNGFVTILTKTNAYLIKHNDAIIKDATAIGARNFSNGLWDVNLAKNKTVIANYAYEEVCNSAYHMATIKDLIVYLHRACFSPTMSTWTQAIDAGYFATWPGLTSKLVKKISP